MPRAYILRPSCGRTIYKVALPGHHHGLFLEVGAALAATPSVGAELQQRARPHQWLRQRGWRAVPLRRLHPRAAALYPRHHMQQPPRVCAARNLEMLAQARGKQQGGGTHYDGGAGPTSIIGIFSPRKHSRHYVRALSQPGDRRRSSRAMSHARMNVWVSARVRAARSAPSLPCTRRSMASGAR